MSQDDMKSETDFPLVSIVIPAYNAEPFFDECLSSVEGQTYRNLEIIIVDDGSTDGTLEIATSHAEHDSRIVVVSQQNQYAGVARNNGMDLATGEYICFLDADDVFRPKMIERMVCRAEESRSDIVVCRSAHLDNVTHAVSSIDYSLCLVDLKKEYSGAELKDVMFRFCVGWPWDKLYRLSYVKRVGLRFQPLRTTNDAYFVFLSLIYAGRIVFVDEEFVLHRTNNSNSLEYSRGKSSKNALVAASAIKDNLCQNGLYSDFERSYVNWVVNFFAWNIKTLTGDAKTEFVSMVKSEVTPLIPGHIDGSYFFLKRDAAIADLLKMDPVQALSKAIDLAFKEEDLTNEMAVVREEARRSKMEHQLEIDRLSSMVDTLNTQLSEEREAKLALEESTSYKVGKAIMALPCKIKDATLRFRDR